MSAPDLVSAWPIIRFADIDSTNEEARRRAEQGDFGPVWLTAERQTAGRGRLGRTWESPSGNLFATALMELVVPLAEASKICFAAGLAVLDAAESCGAAAGSLRLKWPNDVLLGDAKAGGILIETGSAAGRMFMAAGFGVNVKTAPETPGRATACLMDLPELASLDAQTLLQSLDTGFRKRLKDLFQNGFDEVRRDWLARSAYLGRTVEVYPGGNRILGVMRDLDADGALVLELADGAFFRVRAGDVSLAA